MESGSGCDGGASNVPEGDVVGHLQGDSSCESTYLLMDVHEEGVRFPSAHFLDRVGVDSV